MFVAVLFFRESAVPGVVLCRKRCCTEKGVEFMQYRVGFEVRKLSNLVKKRIDHLSEETGLTGFQGYLMSYLVKEGGKLEEPTDYITIGIFFSGMWRSIWRFPGLP